MSETKQREGGGPEGEDDSPRRNISFPNLAVTALFIIAVAVILTFALSSGDVEAAEAIDPVASELIAKAVDMEPVEDVPDEVEAGEGDKGFFEKGACYVAVSLDSHWDFEAIRGFVEKHNCKLSINSEGTLP